MENLNKLIQSLIMPIIWYSYDRRIFYSQFTLDSWLPLKKNVVNKLYNASYQYNDFAVSIFNQVSGITEKWSIKQTKCVAAERKLSIKKLDHCLRTALCNDWEECESGKFYQNHTFI